MIVLLPPSETKRDGGDGQPLDLGALRHSALTDARRTMIAATMVASVTSDAAAHAFRISPKLAEVEAVRNRSVWTAPTMAAVDRYTGVLYDALDAGTLESEARDWLGNRVRVHSALFGLVGALDGIPAYRCSHDSRVGVHLRRHWQHQIAAELRADFVVDLRSEAYTHLGPAPAERSVFVRVVTDDGEGQRRALNHYNKHGKGAFVRSLAQHGPETIESTQALLVWARGAGWRLEPLSAGEIALVL